MKNRSTLIVYSGYNQEKVTAHFKMAQPWEKSTKVSID